MNLPAQGAESLQLKVEQQGPGACHTGRRSCFYRALPLGKGGAVALQFRDADKACDPAGVHRRKILRDSRRQRLRVIHGVGLSLLRNLPFFTV